MIVQLINPYRISYVPGREIHLQPLCAQDSIGVAHLRNRYQLIKPNR